MKKKLLSIFSLILFSSNVQAIQYTYDALSRLTKVVYDNNGFIEYQYDKAGNLLTVATTPSSGDAIAPVINVSSGINIELNQGNNLPVTDNRIADFLNGVTATDNIEGQVNVNHNAPSSFSLGITSITFTANDTAGNSANATASITLSSLDGDSDNLLDTWEIRYGLDPLNPGDALLDLDNDGVTNLAEFNANSNPSVNQFAIAIQPVLQLLNNRKKAFPRMPAYLIPNEK